ncbi:hypothetical protein BN1708_012501 [Verticillium longisporum]|uniref:Uncharacterized protein n=1 Tax=Verticillium longisporum TaxID=100787 RepID=A0A0G4LAF8_VERLO|nr:hypothetical protein BN1708_012501 [Verticillium longisporum]
MPIPARGWRVDTLLEDSRATSSFSFRRNESFEEQETGVKFHMCCTSSCIRRYRRAHCYHAGCHSFNLFPISPTFLAATKYDFSPPISSERRRQGRIKHLLARKLKVGLMRRIPLELCHLTAAYLVRECSIVAYQELARDVRPSDFVVHLSQDVYATYKKLEGAVYLQTLGNAPQPGEGMRVFDAGQGHAIQNIYVGYDHLGIRSIRFVLPGHDLPQSLHDCSGVWWTGLARKDGILRIMTRSDGLKVRGLLDTTDSPSARNNIVLGPGWPTPGPDYRLIDLDTCDFAMGTPERLRMSSFDCNKPTTHGYSAAINGLHIAKLYAHHSGASRSDFGDVDAVSSSTLWMYMPVEQDEYLKEIWAIKTSASRTVALMFLTSHERGVIFGGYILHPKIQLQFHCIYATTNHASRIYFHDWDPLYDEQRIKYFGVDANTTETEISLAQDQQHRTRYPPSLTPSSPPPYTQYNEAWYYTNCRLEDVVEVTCCIDQSAPHQPIIGMLLRYGNRHRACVGQYRLDWALDTISVDRSKMLSIGLGRTKRRFLYVAELGLQRLGTTDSGSLSWMNIPWHGRLEWWFSQRQSKLNYSE